MTAPDCDPSVCAKAQASASEGGKPQRDAREGVPTLSRRSLLLQGVSLLVLYVATVPSPAAALGLPKSLSKATVQQMKDKARRDVKAVLDRLNRDLPGVVKQVVGTAGGGLLGGLGSFFALSSGGAVAGLSASGITSGLAAAGAIVGGGMVAGVGVLAIPVVMGGLIGSRIFTSKKPVLTLERAIQDLETIKVRLKPTRYFRREITEIENYIKKIERQKAKIQLL